MQGKALPGRVVSQLEMTRIANYVDAAWAALSSAMVLSSTERVQMKQCRAYYSGQYDVLCKGELARQLGV